MTAEVAKKNCQQEVWCILQTKESLSMSDEEAQESTK